MTQPSLFEAIVIPKDNARFVQRDICLGRHGGNAESQEAHERVKAGKTDVWARIMDYARSKPLGVTCDECAQHFGVSPNQISGRLTELLAQGRLVRTAERRKTRSGCMAKVLLVTQRRG